MLQQLSCVTYHWSWIVVRMPVFLGFFYQTYYNAVRVELTTRTTHVAIRMIVTVTEGGEEPTGAGRGPSCEGDELSGG